MTNFNFKSTFVFAILAALSLATVVSTASAGNNTPGVDKRQHNQATRIYNGVQNGSLTLNETGQLIRGQARIRRMERRFKSDGVVTAGERIRLHRAQNRQSRRIFRKKHN